MYMYITLTRIPKNLNEGLALLAPSKNVCYNKGPKMSRDDFNYLLTLSHFPRFLLERLWYSLPQKVINLLSTYEKLHCIGEPYWLGIFYSHSQTDLVTFL